MGDDQPGPSQQDTNGDQQIVKAERKQVANQAEDIRSMLQAMAVQRHKDGIKEQYDFWETQPVAQFNEDPSTLPVTAQPAALLPKHCKFLEIQARGGSAARRWSNRCSKDCAGSQAGTISSARHVSHNGILAFG